MTEYIFTGPFGIIDMTFKYLLCMLTPLVTAFAFCRLFLEGSGILTWLERSIGGLLSYAGLSSDCLLPLLSGLGCTTAALSSLDGIESAREKYIVSFLLSVTVPCSAQTAVIAGIALVLPPSLFIIYISAIVAVFIISGLLLNMLLPADTIYHTPRTKNSTLHMPVLLPLLKSACSCGIAFLKQAILPFAAGSIVLSILSYYGFLDYLCRICSPLTENFLLLPKEAAALFIMSIVKRDFGAAGLLSVINRKVFTSQQLTVSMIILTLFVPCFASVIVLLKQQGIFKTLSIWAGSMLTALLMGKLASMLLIS